ncbi:hypothetical protein QE152_g8912 [Popillia japonica]|uniref:Uncharacterized protein n=1 Tax=Popillia japonica TaxID=7064 RepID=A0AAW1M0W7_POPJA
MFESLNSDRAEKVMIMFEPLNSDIELSDEDGDEDYIIESEHNSSSDESADENEEIIENSNEEEANIILAAMRVRMKTRKLLKIRMKRK